MIKLFIGAKGSGKTKTLIELVNSAAGSSKGSVVCIEKGDKLIHDVTYSVGVSSGGDVLPWNNNDYTGVNVDCAHNLIIVWCKVDRSSTTAQFTVKYTKD